MIITCLSYYTAEIADPPCPFLLRRPSSVSPYSVCALDIRVNIVYEMHWQVEGSGASRERLVVNELVDVMSWGDTQFTRVEKVGVVASTGLRIKYAGDNWRMLSTE